MSGENVLSKAEDCCRRIVDIYASPNMTPEQIRAALEANELDPLKDFSTACRTELHAISSTA
jgi:hypothetical protein